MIARYTRPEMGRIWGEENRFRTWLKVEIAATETLAEAKVVPMKAAKAIRELADFRLERIRWSIARRCGRTFRSIISS